MKQPAKIICHVCKHEDEYFLEDFQYTVTPDGIEDDYVECRACGEPTGSSKELQTLIDQLPDYEPDPDMEYERAWEDAHILNT